MLEPGMKLTVFSIKRTRIGNSIWVRAGNAYVNRDYSLNVWLDVLPLHGALHLREAVDPKKEAADVSETADAVTAPATDEGAGMAADAREAPALPAELGAGVAQ